MKYIKKLVVGSLVVALVSFGGGFCAHPMVAQASETDTMDMSHGHEAEHGGVLLQAVDMSTVALSACVFDCISKAPQATIIKKTALDKTVQVSVIDSRVDQRRFVEYFSDSLDAIGTDPPFPDILSSIMKKE